MALGVRITVHTLRNKPYSGLDLLSRDGESVVPKTEYHLSPELRSTLPAFCRSELASSSRNRTEKSIIPMYIIKVHKVASHSLPCSKRP